MFLVRYVGFFFSLSESKAQASFSDRLLFVVGVTVTRLFVIFSNFDQLLQILDTNFTFNHALRNASLSEGNKIQVCSDKGYTFIYKMTKMTKIHWRY